MTSYPTTDRVLSISFILDPDEHAAAMLDAGRRLIADTDRSLTWGKALGAAIGLGAGVGIVTELHRRFVLPLIFGPVDMVPLSIAAIELLPLIAVIAVLCFVLYRRTAQRRRIALAARLRPGLAVDLDIFSKGVRLTTERSMTEYDWQAARNILAVRNGMEIEYDCFAIFIPARAFGDHAAFVDAGKLMRRIWREAVKRDHDSKLIAAGLG